MRKIILICLIVSSFMSMTAQWRIGITAGASYNNCSIDNHYMSDWHYEGTWGNIIPGNLNLGTFGIMGQYDINDWLGIRTDINLTMKNHREYRTLISTNYEVMNHYLQLPLMASFSCGNQKLRGFFNLGFYTGFWLDSHNDGIMDNKYTSVKTGYWKNEFDNVRDQRLDLGLVGGAGFEWRFIFLNKYWSWQIFEARIYYSTISTQKDYMKIKDPRYNTTLVLQSGLIYFL